MNRLNITCPSCQSRMAINSNRAILWRKEIRDIILKELKNSPHNEKMSENYLNSRADQITDAEIQRQIRSITKDINKKGEK